MKHHQSWFRSILPHPGKLLFFLFFFFCLPCQQQQQTAEKCCYTTKLNIARRCGKTLSKPRRGTFRRDVGGEDVNFSVTVRRLPDRTMSVQEMGYLTTSHAGLEVLECWNLNLTPHHYRRLSTMFQKVPKF